MNLSDFYLICFVAGFVLSLMSFVGGSFHLPHAHLHIHHGKGGAGAINFGTVTAFLTWFGGVGFLLTRFSAATFFLIVLAAIGAGLVGATLVFLFVVKVLSKHDKDLDPDDYEMCGALGKVSSTVRPNGTGEMIFVQQGVRRGAPIRSEDGQSIPKGTEVVVTRYEGGIAYVREFNGF